MPAAFACAAGSANAPAAQRREHWTYANGARRSAVDVAVRGADFRTSAELDGLTYRAGRASGARWHADGNGIVHGVQADLQGDALDSAPQALCAIDAANCSLAGEARSSARVGDRMTPSEDGTSADLHARFLGGTILVPVDIAGAREQFLLDTGTTSITVDRGLARRYGGTTVDHAVLPSRGIGPVRFDHVSVVSVDAPWAANILALDFFRGRVVDIDYRTQRVRIVSPADARAAFADGRTTTIAANVDQGLPLVPAAFGDAASDTFALDTGSPQLDVMRPFADADADEIRAHWRPDGLPFVESYLEGGIELLGYIAPQFSFAGARGANVAVGVPFAGIIGTDILRSFELLIDYDTGRIGVRS